jgi:hypothetical protein
LGVGRGVGGFGVGCGVGRGVGGFGVGLGVGSGVGGLGVGGIGLCGGRNFSFFVDIVSWRGVCRVVVFCLGFVLCFCLRWWYWRWRRCRTRTAATSAKQKEKKKTVIIFGQQMNQTNTKSE